MSADKRTPHTDALETLGTVFTTDEKRDAIHLGVEPVVAGMKIIPGEDLYLIDGVAYSAKGTDRKAVGIADPFIRQRGGIKQGQKFWLVVYPRQITSLRHVWTHPDFPDTADIPQTREPEQKPTLGDVSFDVLLAVGDPDALAIKAIADDLEVSVDWLMGIADETQAGSGEGWYYHPEDSGAFEGKDLPDHFWYHYAVLRNKKQEDLNREIYFTCSC